MEFFIIPDNVANIGDEGLDHEKNYKEGKRILSDLSYNRGMKNKPEEKDGKVDWGVVRRGFMRAGGKTTGERFALRRPPAERLATGTEESAATAKEETTDGGATN